VKTGSVSFARWTSRAFPPLRVVRELFDTLSDSPSILRWRGVRGAGRRHSTGHVATAARRYEITPLCRLPHHPHMCWRRSTATNKACDHIRMRELIAFLRLHEGDSSGIVVIPNLLEDSALLSALNAGQPALRISSSDELRLLTIGSPSDELRRAALDTTSAKSAQARISWRSESRRVHLQLENPAGDRPGVDDISGPSKPPVGKERPRAQRPLSSMVGY